MKTVYAERAAYLTVTCTRCKESDNGLGQHYRVVCCICQVAQVLPSCCSSNHQLSYNRTVTQLEDANATLTNGRMSPLVLQAARMQGTQIKLSDCARDWSANQQRMLLFKRLDQRLGISHLISSSDKNLHLRRSAGWIRAVHQSTLQVLP